MSCRINQLSTYFLHLSVYISKINDKFIFWWIFTCIDTYCTMHKYDQYTQNANAPVLYEKRKKMCHKGWLNFNSSLIWCKLVFGSCALTEWWSASSPMKSPFLFLFLALISLVGSRPEFKKNSIIWQVHSFLCISFTPF